MYKISYEKCVYFIFLVICLARVLSCSGFRIDNLAMTDIITTNSNTNNNNNNNKRNHFHASTTIINSSNVAAALDPANRSSLSKPEQTNASPFSSLLSSYRQRKHKIRHHRLLKVQQRLESLRNRNKIVERDQEDFVIPPQPPPLYPNLYPNQDPHVDPSQDQNRDPNRNPHPNPSHYKSLVTRTQRSFSSSSHRGPAFKGNVSSNYSSARSNSRPGRKTKPYCQEDDLSRKAYLARIVVKVQSESIELKNLKKTYTVMFRKIQVLKNISDWPVDERIALTFMYIRNGSTHCDQQHQHHHYHHNSNNHNNNNNYPRDRINNNSNNNNVRNLLQQDYYYRNKLVKADIKSDREYILFLNANGPHDYTASYTPELVKSKQLLKVLQRVTNPNFKPKDPQIESLELVNRTESRNVPKLKLVCKTRRGLPVPYTVWKRNDIVLQPNSRIHIKYKKRKSKLVIKNVTEEDRGRYECVAHGVNDKVAKKSIDISSDQIVQIIRASYSMTTKRPRIPTTTTTTTSEIYGAEPCEDAFQKSFCENGGTCYNQSSIGELYCICPEGYTGRRCDTKRPKNASMYIQPARSSCKSGLSTKYHCNNTEIDITDYST